MSKSKIKICGIKNIETLYCCIINKVDFFGLIFYDKSPRNIKLEEASKLIEHSKDDLISSVGVFVDEPIDQIKQILSKIKLDYIQLHGEENNDYIKEIKKNKLIKIIKNIPINSTKDFMKIKNYNNTDMFLFDYKPKKNELPGGNAKKFSWEILSNLLIEKPWFLSGGINKDNINTIKNFIIPYGIDISSGVEEKIGIKSNDKITSLLKIYE